MGVIVIYDSVSILANPLRPTDRRSFGFFRVSANLTQVSSRAESNEYWNLAIGFLLVLGVGGKGVYGSFPLRRGHFTGLCLRSGIPLPARGEART